MTKQTTIVVIGSLRVKASLFGPSCSIKLICKTSFACLTKLHFFPNLININKSIESVVKQLISCIPFFDIAFVIYCFFFFLLLLLLFLVTFKTLITIYKQMTNLFFYFFFPHFPDKIRFDSSCESSP